MWPHRHSDEGDEGDEGVLQPHANMASMNPSMNPARSRAQSLKLCRTNSEGSVAGGRTSPSRPRYPKFYFRYTGGEPFRP